MVRSICRASWARRPFDHQVDWPRGLGLDQSQKPPSVRSADGTAPTALASEAKAALRSLPVCTTASTSAR
jgi:hypothetical protein